jgi:hypothetical protein
VQHPPGPALLPLLLPPHQETEACRLRPCLCKPFLRHVPPLYSPLLSGNAKETMRSEVIMAYLVIEYGDCSAADLTLGGSYLIIAGHGRRRLNPRHPC